MSWVIFSLIAAIIWAFVNIIDKVVLEKWVRNPSIPVLFFGLLGLVVSSVVFMTVGFSYLDNIRIITALIGGSCFLIATVFYYRAVKSDEVSRIIPYYNLAPLLLLILAAVFLGEIFTPMKYVGIITMVLGAVLISIRDSILPKFGRPFYLLTVSMAFYVFSYIFMKYLLDFADYWTVFGYLKFGVFLASIPFFFKEYNELRYTIKTHGKKAIAAMTSSESISIFGHLSFVIAASIGYITLVETLVSTQSLFLLIFTVFLSLFFPKILKEKISRRAVSIKLVAIMLMIAGVYLII